MEITEAAYTHIITRHMNGYENARWDSQFMDKLTKDQIFSICLRLTKDHLDPLYKGGENRNYFYNMNQVIGWATGFQETTHVRVSMTGRFINSVYPITIYEDKLAVLRARGVA